MIKLEYKSQPTSVTCVQTCLAMIFNIHVEDVIADMGSGPQFIEDEFKFILRQNAYPFLITQSVPNITAFPIEGIYLATVPSKTKINQQHRVVIVSGQESNDIYDPCSIPGKQYTAEDSCEGISIMELTHVVKNYF